MGPLSQIPPEWGDADPIELGSETIAWLHATMAKRFGHHSENAYHCGTCGRNTVTIDVHPGVTPIFTTCRATSGCTGQATSSGYPTAPRPDNLPAPAWEWYRPGCMEYAHLNRDRRDHVDKGGLLLRRRSDPPLPGAYVAPPVEQVEPVGDFL